MAPPMRRYTLPHALARGDGALVLAAGLALCPGCRGCSRAGGVLVVPMREFDRCLVRRPFPRIGSVLADFVLYSEEGEPVVALPATIPDETQVMNYIITFAFYLLCLLIILVKVIVRSRRKDPHVSRIQKSVLLVSAVLSDMKQRKITKARRRRHRRRQDRAAS